ncbi:hypothetical protein KoPa4_00034 [Pseudomonas phage vB_PpuM-KoPa-4]|uniref:Uncharacterized protein n=1 Tax=Pseudomonas phage vB_PpuM-KoPa-4 TaxID=3132618 RepID=A0AAX4MXQ6_9CAUD
MTDKNLKFVDTFRDEFTISLSDTRMAINIKRRPNGQTPSMLCMTHEDTIRLRDELNKRFPIAQVKTVVGDVHIDSRTPTGITINATGNVIINN